MILGLTASLAYSISFAFLGDHQRELMDYFECEHCGVNSGQMCDRSGFKGYTCDKSSTDYYWVQPLCALPCHNTGLFR